MPPGCRSRAITANERSCLSKPSAPPATVPIRGRGRTRCTSSVASAESRRRVTVASLHPLVSVDEELLPRDLEALRRFAYLMDEAVAIPGTRRRVGVDAA